MRWKLATNLQQEHWFAFRFKWSRKSTSCTSVKQREYKSWCHRAVNCPRVEKTVFVNCFDTTILNYLPMWLSGCLHEAMQNDKCVFLNLTPRVHGPSHPFMDTRKIRFVSLCIVSHLYDQWDAIFVTEKERLILIWSKCQDKVNHL